MELSKGQLNTFQEYGGKLREKRREALEFIRRLKKIKSEIKSQ